MPRLWALCRLCSDYLIRAPTSSRRTKTASRRGSWRRWAIRWKSLISSKRIGQHIRRNHGKGRRGGKRLSPFSVLPLHINLHHLPVLDRLAIEQRGSVLPHFCGRQELRVVPRVHRLPYRDALDVAFLVDDDFQHATIG